jgi:hypothetical protein
VEVEIYKTIERRKLIEGGQNVTNVEREQGAKKLEELQEEK